MVKKNKQKNTQDNNVIRLLNTRVLGNKLLATTAMTMAGMLAMASSAYAVGNNENPTNPNVVGGSASFNGLNTNDLTVTQTNTNRTVIDWDSFNIGKNAKTEFKQLDNNSMTVNRVTGGTDPSKILGTLKSSVNGQRGGRIMILDPNGVLLGKNATIDVGGIVASTGEFKNQNAWLNGADKIKLRNLDANGDVSVINKALINVKDGGLLAFIAPTVKNAGIINARQGYVALASGKHATLDFYGDNLINVSVSGKLKKSLVENSSPDNIFGKGGQIYADGGTVTMTAGAAKSAIDSVVNMHGVVRANSFSNQNGKIVLASKGDVNVSGQLQARNETPSQDLNDADITITAKRDVNITSDAHHFFSGVTDGIFANSLNHSNGDGGSVYIWGKKRVTFAGKIDVGAGHFSGNGGQVEISTDGDLAYRGRVDASANNGTRGTLTLDPDVVTIGNSTFDPIVNAGALAETLGLTNVHIIAGSKIVLVDDADLSHWGFGGFSVTNGDLTLEAPTVDLLKNLKMGHGDLAVDADTINLGGKLYRNTAFFNWNIFNQLLGQSDLTGTASVVNVLGNSASIQQGIDLATDAGGAKVYVAAANYAENINIYKSLTLQGLDGIDGQPLLFGTTPGGTVVMITANNVTVDGFDIMGQTVPWYLPSLNAIVAENVSNIRLTNNNIQGPIGYGVVLNNVAGALVQNNTVSAALAGILANGGSKLGLYGNTILGTLTGIRMNGGSDNVIGGNTVKGALFNGIELVGTTLTDVVRNFVVGAGWDGIRLDHASGSTVAGNTVLGAGNNGIDVNSGKKISVTQNNVFGAVNDGVSATKVGGLNISDNNIGLVGGNGIDVNGALFARIMGNNVAGVGGHGIKLAHAGFSSIGGNVILGTGADGIHATGVKGLGISKNFVGAAGDDGVDVNNSFGVDVFGNIVKFSGDNGVEVINSAGMSVANNAIFFSGNNGVFIDPSFGSVTGNFIFGSGNNGIQILDTDGYLVAGNTIIGSGHDGIHVTNSNGTRVLENTVIGSGRNGIFVKNAAGTTIAGNDVSLSGRNGIKVRQVKFTGIFGNHVSFSGHDGIRANQAFGTKIMNNAVGLSGHNGITVRNAHYTGIGGNKVFGSGNDGIKVGHSFNTGIFGNNVFFSGRNGMTIRHSGHTDIVGNMIAHSDRNGIKARDVFDTDIKYNTVKASGHDGIRVAHAYDTSILRNKVKGSAHNGITVRKSKFAGITGNKVFGSGNDGIKVGKSFGTGIFGNDVLFSGRNGVTVRNSAMTSLGGNLIGFSGNDGIHVAHAYGTSIFGNKVFHSGGDGMDIRDAKHTKIGFNKVMFSGENGIKVADSKGTFIKGNYIKGAGQDGINISGSLGTKVLGNSIKYVGNNGISLDDSFGTKIAGNKIQNGGGAGISVFGSALTYIGYNGIEGFYNGVKVFYSLGTALAGNTISGIVNDGIQIAYSGLSALFGNDISGYGDDGVQVSNSKGVLIYGNNIDGGSVANAGIRIGSNEEGPRKGPRERFEEDGPFLTQDDSPFNLSERRPFFLGTAPFSGSGGVIIANNNISNNAVGLDATAQNNGYIGISGNQFTNNDVGMHVSSGLINLTGATNTFTGGRTAMVFDGPYYPSYGFTGLALVNDSLGTTIFEGQTDYYVDLRNGAFYDPGQPTLIDGTQATYDGVPGGLMTPAQLLAIQAKINDYNDDRTLGLIFAGFANLNDNLILKKILGNQYRAGRARVFVTGLPSTTNPGSGNTPFFSVRDLANLAPAAGGDGTGFSIEDLANLEPSAGGGTNSVLSGACWANLGGGGGFSMDLSGDATSILADQAACNG